MTDILKIEEFFPRLISGQLEKQSQGDSLDIQVFIQQQIKNLCVELGDLGSKSDSFVTTYGPFIGRTILELSLTALVARFDPFRLLVLREVQRQPTYQVGARALTAIQWTGDIQPREKVNDPWSCEKEFSKIPRTLLGQHYDDLFWKVAFQKLLDTVESGRGGDWLTQLRLIDPKDFIPRVRHQLGDLYSSLSKGIHHEFVVPPEAMYDRTVISNLLDDEIQWISGLGLVSHLTDHCCFKLEVKEAIALYEKLQEL